MELVTLTHPKTGRTVVVPESAVPTHENSGWQRSHEQPPPQLDQMEQQSDGEVTEPEDTE